MKRLINKIILNRMVTIVQKIYQKWPINISKFTKSTFSKDQYDSLTALKCIVSYNKYGGYCVPESSRHRSAAKRILSKDVYEPKTIEFIISNCGDGDIVHAGTYFGDFLPALSKACASGSKVWAFEPNSENYRCASITLKINDINNVVLINAGLGIKKECLLIKITDEGGRALGGASQVINHKQNKELGTEKVQIVTLDNAIGIDRNISIIQLDVEGHEKEALAGALGIINRCLPIIIIEVWPNSTLLDSNWFSEHILSLGYCKIKSIHENSVFYVDNKQII